MRSRWCWVRAPNRHWENKKYFSAKTNALEFNQGREDLGRKTNLQNILVISLWGRTIRTLSEGKQISVSTFTYGHNCPVTCVFCVSVSAPQLCLRYYEHEFVELACQCPAVVCCRCSPTQKAQIVTLLQQHTANRTCAIGECWQIMWQQALRARDGLLASVHKQPGKICQEESGWDGGGEDVCAARPWGEENIKQCVKDRFCKTAQKGCFYCNSDTRLLFIYYFLYPQDGSKNTRREAPSEVCCFYNLRYQHEAFSKCVFVCFVTGDGGNDVSMIQAADCGIGIEGKVHEAT